MRIGYDRDKTEEYSREFGAVIITGNVPDPDTYIAGMPALEGLTECIKAAGLDDVTEVGSLADFAAGNKTGYFIIPVSYPLISTSILRKMMEWTGEKGTDKPAAACFEGKLGYPLYLPASLICDAKDMECIREKCLKVETEDEACVLSMETEEGYKDITGFVSKGFAREKLELLTARKRMFVVCCDEGLSGDLISVCGREIAAAMREDVEAEALGMDKFGKEPMPAIERIYSSEMKSDSEMAEAICSEINTILPEPVKVRKISGLADSAEDETVYDMQYRVVGALRELLRFDDAKDIILVVHSNVCRALEQNINGRRVDDEWVPMAAGSFRMFEPFPQQPSEKAGNEDKPLTSDSLTMEAVLEYYE